MKKIAIGIVKVVGTESLKRMKRWVRTMALESISKEKKEAIARDYLDLSIKVHEIPKKYHISPTTLKERRITERHLYRENLKQ